MTTKIIGKAKGELDVKRFYIPGVKIESKCPKCGTKYVKDLERDYFFEPSVNQPQDFHFECEKEVPKNKGGIRCDSLQGRDIYLCKEEWDVPVKFDIVVSKA